MRPLVLTLAAVVLTACGTPSAQTGITPYPASAGRTSSTPTSGQTTSLPHCKLPVATNEGNGARAGFVTLPEGAFTPDHRGDWNQGFQVQLGNPPLTGTWPRTNVAEFPTYDSLDRWVPVSPQQLSPDGKQYVYEEWVMPTNGMGPTPPSAIRTHVVDVSTASDHVIDTTTKNFYSVVSWQPEGIYLTQQCWEGCGFVGGMWLMDATTGSAKSIVSKDSDHTDWRWIASGVAWGMGPSGGSNVYRLDLNSGAVTFWVGTANGLYVVGLDPNGLPLIESQDPATSGVELADGGTSAASATRLFPPSSSAPQIASFQFAVMDGSRTWLGGTAGLAEVTATLQVIPVNTSLTPGTAGIAPAGPCLPL